MRAHGYFYDFLREKSKTNQSLPPKIYLHAYAGNEEITKQLLKLNIDSDLYFGFSSSSNLRNEEKLAKVLKLISPSKLLLESDGECVMDNKETTDIDMRNNNTNYREVAVREDLIHEIGDGNDATAAAVASPGTGSNVIERDLMKMRDFMCKTLEMNMEDLCMLTANNAHAFFGSL